MELTHSVTDKERCEDCGDVLRFPDYSHICSATCPNGDSECPGPGVNVVTSDVCSPCRRARRRVVLPLENR